MKAIQIQETGGAEVLRSVECVEPSPGEQDCLIELEASGLNYIDTYHRSGLYPLELPFIPGIEGVGRLLSIGDSSLGLHVGQRVGFCDAPGGAYAERIALPSKRLIPIPEEISASDACALLVQGLTAHYLVNSTFQLQKTHRCLIHAGAGGVGLILTQLAKQTGAFVVTTVSTAQKAQLSKEAGADLVINYQEEDFVAVVAEHCEGGLDVVFDSVGQSTFLGSLNCLKSRGMMVSYGNASGAVEPIPPLSLAPKSLFLTRPKLFDYIETREELLVRAQGLFELYLSGALSVRIGATYELRDAEQAHRDLEARATVGKSLLISRPSGD